jgi:peroxiredoxin
VRVLGVHAASSEDRARSFAEGQRATHSILLDEEGVVVDYGVKGIPHTVIIDKRGDIRATHVGFSSRDPAAMEAEVLALLEEQGSPGAAMRGGHPGP